MNVGFFSSAGFDINALVSSTLSSSSSLFEAALSSAAPNDFVPCNVPR